MRNLYPSDEILYMRDIPHVDPITLNITSHILNQSYADAPEVLERQVTLTEQETLLLQLLLLEHPRMHTVEEVAFVFDLPHHTLLQQQRVEKYVKPIVKSLDPKLVPFNLQTGRVPEDGYVMLHKWEE